MFFVLRRVLILQSPSDVALRSPVCRTLSQSACHPISCFCATLASSGLDFIFGPQHAIAPEISRVHSATLVDANVLEQWSLLLKSMRNVIFCGPPGTGKSWTVQQYARHLAGARGRVFLVQFHPAYSYEDFVCGYRPVAPNGANVSDSDLSSGGGGGGGGASYKLQALLSTSPSVHENPAPLQYSPHHLPDAHPSKYPHHPRHPPIHT